MSNLATTLASSKEILSTLIAFDTISHQSNLALIDWIENYLSDWDISCTRLHNEEQSKANLVAYILPKQAKSSQPAILFSGHTDVVPVAGQNWTSNPFELVEKDNRWYGRGSCDMKGFIACCLALVPHWIEHAKQPIYLAFSYDEEVGCLGVHSIVDYLADCPHEIDFAIIGEPTNMALVTGHKGIHVGRCKIHGKAAHSSLPDEGISAIRYASELVLALYQLGEDERVNGVQDNDFDVPYSTLNIGQIDGGKAANIIAEDCEFTFDYRYLPQVDPTVFLNKLSAKAQTIEQTMQTKSADTHIKVETIAHALGLLPHPDTGKYIDTLKQLTDYNGNKVAYATEAGTFTSKGDIVAIICGPGSIEQAHKPDEFIEISEIEKCLKFLHDICG